MSSTKPASITTAFKYRLPLVPVLGSISALTAVAIDMYLPALPQMERELHARPWAGALSVAGFFVGVCFGQLCYGPLSDRIGRKTPLLAGICLYVIGSIGCTFATSIEMLIVMRFLEALGGCAGMVIARAMVRDLFTPQQTANVLSVLMLVVGLTPILAPLAGSFVLTFGSWRLIFGLLAAWGLSAWIMVMLCMRETSSAANRSAARAESVFASYFALLREKRVMGYCLALGCSQASILTYVTAGPDVLIGGYGLSPQAFATMFACNGIGLVAANAVNRQLLKRLSYDRILRWANLANMTAALVLLADAVTGFGGFAGITAPLFVVVAGMGFTQANAFAGAMAADPQRAGAISALAGALQFGIGASAAALSGALHDGTAKPMAMVILTSYLLSGVILRVMTPLPPRVPAPA